MLGDFGVVAPIVDFTPILPSRRRDEEILAWLARHPEVAAHAVVDDELRVPESSPLAPHLVGTQMAEGLTFAHVAPLVERLSLPYRAPWRGVDPAAAASLEAQLGRELTRRHVLFGRRVAAVARRQDCDDVLFELDGAGASGAFAVVHLTWSGTEERDPRFPATEVFAARWRFEEQCMLPEAEDFEA